MSRKSLGFLVVGSGKASSSRGFLNRLGGFVDIVRYFAFGVLGVREVLGSFLIRVASGAGRSSVSGCRV